MKRLAFVSILAALAATAPAANAAERGEARATVAGKAVSVEYGRPLLRGRDMLARAEAGRAWRMGADAATTLTTEADLAFGPAAVPRGTYVLTATRLSDGHWQLNLARNDPDRTAVAAVALETHKLPASVEQFTIELKGEGDRGELAASWGDVALKAAFTAR
jgi:hypothetical protein